MIILDFRNKILITLMIRLVKIIINNQLLQKKCKITISKEIKNYIGLCSNNIVDLNPIKNKCNNGNSNNKINKMNHINLKYHKWLLKCNNFIWIKIQNILVQIWNLLILLLIIYLMPSNLIKWLNKSMNFRCNQWNKIKIEDPLHWLKLNCI